MSKLISSITFFFCIYAAPIFAQPTNGKTLLWEIKGNGLQKPSYLFGTIHIICKEDFVLTENVRSKWNNADQVFLELDMDDPKLQMNLMKMMQLPKGITLKSIFGNDQYLKLDLFFKENIGMSVEAMNGYKPMMLMSLLYMKLLPCKETASYEEELIKLAKIQKKNIFGLESIEEQMGVFDSIPDEQEAESIIQMIDEHEKSDNELRQMISLYKNKDVEALYQFAIESPSTKGYEQLFLYNRNRSWIPVMGTALKQGACFFAVGAAHLGGEEGLINLLRKAGYEVNPVAE